MVSTEQLLTQGHMSLVINRVKPKRTFLQNLLMFEEEVLHTPTAELSSFEGEAEIAPFVRKNGASIMVSADSEVFATIETPNIRISRPIDPEKLMTTRHPGDDIFIDQSNHMSSMEMHLARLQSRMVERIDNTKEYMVSQLLQGQINYQVSEQANFQITVPRLATHDITLADPTDWDNAVQTAVRPYEDFDLAKHLISEEESSPLTDALLGTTAATHFLRNAEVRALLNKDSGIMLGGMDLRRQYEADGAIYLGEFSGVRCWKYPRLLNVAGTPTPLIRADYVEFVSAVPQSESRTYYGAIPDMDAYIARNFIGKIFSKTWTNPDPSHLRLLAHSRPLPWFPRPNMNVSMKVTNI
jgi:hypothetical protein